MNYNTYTSEMSKSVWDKAFFMDKIPGTKCVIDFGCADGAMIRYLAPLFPDIMFIGYDINIDLLVRAQNYTPFFDNIIFTSYADFVVEYVKLTKKFLPEEICINFSSVLHEVYSSTGGIEDIQKLVETLQPRYITIRDMYCDEDYPIITDEDKYEFNKIWRKLFITLVFEFEKKWGAIRSWKQLTHFLMKYQWKENGWEDELKENYYSWNIDEFVDTLGYKYMPVFECHYQLPYLSEKWKKEYDWYRPDIHTHAQFILRRL